MSFSALPQELVDKICAASTSNKDLKALRLVNRTCNAGSTSVLFRSFKVRPTIKVMRNFSQVAQSSFGEHIRSISILEKENRPHNTVAPPEDRNSEKGRDEVSSLLFAAIKHLTRLEEVHISAGFAHATASLFPALIDAWVGVMAMIPLPSLTRLRIKNWALNVMLVETLHYKWKCTENIRACLRRNLHQIREMDYTHADGVDDLPSETLLKDAQDSKLFAFERLKFVGFSRHGEDISTFGWAILWGATNLREVHVHMLRLHIRTLMTLLNENKISLKSVKLSSIDLIGGSWREVFMAMSETCPTLAIVETDSLEYQDAAADWWSPPRILGTAAISDSDMPGITLEDNKALKALLKELTAKRNAGN